MALDVSDTKISYYAIKRLAQMPITATDASWPNSWRGPWPLRILRLRNCSNIDNLVFPILPKFPLLCVIGSYSVSPFDHKRRLTISSDLRGTRCIPRSSSLSPEWQPSQNSDLFFLSTLSHAIDALAQSDSHKLYSSQDTFKLWICAVQHREPERPSKCQRFEQEKGERQQGAISPILFYGNLQGDKKHYAAESYYMKKENDFVRSSFSDGVSRSGMNDRLMLQRAPPPWDALEKAALDRCGGSGGEVKRRRKGEEVVAVKGGQYVQGSLARLQEAAMRCRERPTSMSMSAGAVAVKPSACARNPFSRRRVALASLMFLLYRLAIARHIARRVHTRRSLSTALPSKQRRPYTFYIGASWAAKSHDPFERHLQLPFPSDGLVGTWRDNVLAWPKNVESKDPGEDFLYIQSMRENSGISFGVADGVGGWTVSGVDPALFSQALMYHAHRYSRNAWAGEPEIDPTLDYEEREQIEGWEMTPYECLDLAYGGVLREKFVQAGSSTACLINLNASSGVLRSANLGDSGYSIIRNSSIIYRQRPQTHYFNCPKQLTKLPTNAGRKFAGACIDSPSEAQVHEAKLRDGDIVVAYTDGFSDNVFPSEMVAICSLVARAGGTEGEQVQAMADRMVGFARQCMRSKRVSPFERAAAREGMFFRGGWTT
ncbi:hypothetical protein AX17_003443 [Amanita inopinata Kibby_2008]|nr:hypothetical protein AX17_003443 [Amanita inopinata Kibby_2008]